MKNLKIFKIEKGTKLSETKIDIGFSEPMTALEAWLVRGAGAVILILII